MKAKPGMWRWVATVLGGIIITVVILGLVTKRNELGQQLILPDGTVITLVKTSFGTEFAYPKPAAWRSLAQHLPSGIVKLWNPIPAGTVAQSFREPALFLLFHRSAAPTNSNTEDAFFAICDESGVEYAPRAEGQSTMLGPWGPRGPSDAKLELRSSQAFPRRSKELIVRAYSWSRTNAGIPLINAGELRISNPAYRSYPQWVPEALPATRSTGDLEVALTQLEAVNDPAEKLRFRRKGLRTGTRAIFKIMQNGKPATKWKPESIRLSDATGNSLYLWAGDLAKAASARPVFFALEAWP
jgi:hypothetical protein